MHLHTRTVRYGKLENGLMVYVRPSLIRRSKHHFMSLPGLDLDLVLGKEDPKCSRTPSEAGGSQMSTRIERRETTP